MWFFESTERRKHRIIELSDPIGAWIRNLQEQPSKEEIFKHLEIANRLVSNTRRLRGLGLNRASLILVETLNVWFLQEGGDRFALVEDPRYKNVVRAFEKLERAIARI